MGGVNPYQYCPNPVRWVDPLGLSCEKTNQDALGLDDLNPNGQTPLKVIPDEPTSTIPKSVDTTTLEVTIKPIQAVLNALPAPHTLPQTAVNGAKLDELKVTDGTVYTKVDQAILNAEKASKKPVQWSENNVNYQASEADEHQRYLLAGALFLNAESINSADTSATLNAIVSNAFKATPNGLCYPEESEVIKGPQMVPWDKAADEKRQRDNANFIATLDAVRFSPLASLSYLSAKASGVKDSERLLGAANTGLAAEGVLAAKQTGQVINRSVGLGGRIPEVMTREVYQGVGAGAKGPDKKPHAATMRSENVPNKTNVFTSVDKLNRAANNPSPNTSYSYGNYTWKTDDLARVSRIEGQATLKKHGRHVTPGEPNTVAIGKEGGFEDVGFHFVGDQFDGPITLADGDILKNLNLSRYKTDFEHPVANIYRDTGNPVSISIEPVYKRTNTTLRPDGFRASYQKPDGAWENVMFKNKAGG